ncbi:UDP-glucose:(heptosyl) LPS alpha1,3-glucosyltransferase WaaG [Klebsiella pneumoniae]|nr:UDP-glucose:(heptosyl) LPS alpha1,3-glucosyltransferase WaaG [Klebsiella pneumoniae]
MSKFRLALVRQKYRPDGGAERFVSRALEALDSSHLQLNVITREWQGPVKPDWQIHICNPRKWGRISRERGFANAARGRSGSASPSTWCRAMNVFPAAISTALAMAFIAAGCSKRSRILPAWKAACCSPTVTTATSCRRSARCMKTHTCAG